MMEKYEIPVVEIVDEVSEGVYAASGDLTDNRVRCRFGRTAANPGADMCQACSYSGGDRNSELPGESLFESDFAGCPDGLPVERG